MVWTLMLEHSTSAPQDLWDPGNLCFLGKTVEGEDLCGEWWLVLSNQSQERHSRGLPLLPAPSSADLQLQPLVNAVAYQMVHVLLIWTSQPLAVTLFSVTAVHLPQKLSGKRVQMPKSISRYQRNALLCNDPNFLLLIQVDGPCSDAECSSYLWVPWQGEKKKRQKNFQMRSFFLWVPLDFLVWYALLIFSPFQESESLSGQKMLQTKCKYQLTDQCLVPKPKHSQTT